MFLSSLIIRCTMMHFGERSLGTALERQKETQYAHYVSDSRCSAYTSRAAENYPVDATTGGQMRREIGPMNLQWALRRNVLPFGVVLFCFTCTLGCFKKAESENGPAPASTAWSKPQSLARVALTMTARLSQGMARIQGTTDLPNGTIIAYEVRHVDMIRRTDLPVDKLFADGTSVVREGKYRSEVDLEGWPAGQIEVWVAFQTVMGGKMRQPPDILKRFGEEGEFLSGPNVVQSGSLKRVELTRTVVLTR